MEVTVIILLSVALAVSVGFLLWQRVKLADAKAQLRVEQMRAETEREQAQMRSEREQAEREQMRETFKNLANDIFEQKSRQMREGNSEELGKILTPLKENIASFEKRINEIHSIEQTQHGSLKTELEQLAKMNATLTREASGLATALRGNSKTQGDWGEMILDRLLEASGLVKGVHYTVQENIKGSEGNDLRPDVVLYLPNEKPIIIDSKVSLTAYTSYINADDEPTAKAALEEHVRSVRKHINELKNKDYSSLLNGTPDFVVMFVPNEPAFLDALRTDTTLWQDAHRSKVIISSPTNLMAVLKIAYDLWKRDDQNRNALEIADEGAKLYDKFVGFLETLENVGRNIKSVSESYDKAVNQLSTGAGNLITRTEKLRKLGIKASKQLPAKFTAQNEK